MNILVLGGTEFVGRHIVEKAIDHGHHVTVFHRGKHGLELFPTAEHILGDRDGGLSALGDRNWDWVVDTCGYVPRIVKQSIDFLLSRAPNYLFISTISVYADMSEPGQNEAAPLATLKDEATEVVDGETYGGLKVLCEQAVEEGYGPHALIVRPGMIVGPYDKTDRFTYWFQRAAKGGRMLSLCERDEVVQFIDGRDLATFCVHLIETNQCDTFNATGPQFGMTWGDIFDEAALSTGKQYEIVRPPTDWLKERGLEVGKAFPAQFDAEDSTLQGVYRVSVEKGIDAGLHFLPLSKTVNDTLAWRGQQKEPLKVGLDPDKERQLLEAYVEV
jgi:2'-hydroxyisoflavone reductase